MPLDGGGRFHCHFAAHHALKVAMSARREPISSRNFLITVLSASATSSPSMSANHLRHGSIIDEDGNEQTERGGYVAAVLRMQRANHHEGVGEDFFGWNANHRRRIQRRAVTRY